MSKQTVVVTFLLVIIIAVGARFYSKRGGSSTLKPYQALGTVAADETAKIIGGSGQIAVIVPDFGGVAVPNYEAEMDSFRKELQKSGTTIATTETLNLSTAPPPKKSRGLKFLEPSSNVPTGPQPGQLGQVINNNGQAKAVVYFVDLPPFNDDDIAALKQRNAKLVVVANWRPEYKPLFQANILQLALVPRWEPPKDASKKPRTMNDWFDKSYAVVTADIAPNAP